MSRLKELHLTTGDTDGVGLEVSVKALRKIGPQKGFKFILYAHPEFLKPIKKMLQLRFKNQLEFIESQQPPVEWVIQAAKNCKKMPEQAALITGPLSKTGIQAAGYKFVGHTEILKRIAGKRTVFQTYLGSQMNVLLVTDHIALDKVSSNLKKKGLFKAALLQAKDLRSSLKLNGKVAVLGLDPHCGEEGLIGNQDQSLSKIVNRLDPDHEFFLGPLPSDTAFESSFRKRVALYVALYHDQGLIPFKALHGFNEGVHLTAGLPFVRTSVDHGTAKEIFGKDLAQPGSMISAIKTAAKLLGNKK